ncbi:MAG: TRAP transporter substrate-binding protein [SAR324 cluster bacterium]|nr:TRAP transporter substrate-binding protein [SAR324 cluster bacterium]
MKNRTVLLVAALCCLSFVFSVSASAKDLSLSSWLPPKHPIVADMIVPWIENVKTATEGRVDIKILAKGLGHPKVHFDIAKDGLADVTFGVHGYQPGRFLLTKSVEFPFFGDSAEATSVAYWRVHQKHLAKGNEHRGVHLLSVFTHGPGIIHNSKKDINSIADLKGMKFRIGGGVVAEVAKSLGMVGLLKPASKNYEILSRGVADGTLLPGESLKSFKITKLVPHSTIVPGGLYNTSFFLVMNSNTFNGLSKKDQEAVTRVSGEAFARLAGKAWDAADKIGIQAAKDDGATITMASDSFVEEIKNATSHIEADWVKKVNSKGIDGAAVMAMLRQEASAK